MGLLPTPPAERLAWDIDGTQFHVAQGNNKLFLSDYGIFFVAGNFTTKTVQDELTELNTPGNSNSLSFQEGKWVALVFVFPQKMDIRGVYVVADRDVHIQSYSQPLVGGQAVDGLLTNPRYTEPGFVTYNPVAYPTSTNSYRDNIESLDAGGDSALSSHAMALYFDNNSLPPASPGLKVYEVHWYGTPVPAQTERLVLLDATFNEIKDPIDIGDNRREDEETFTYHLHNASTSEVLTGVALLDEGTNVSWWKYSFDQVRWRRTLNFGDMGPGTTKKFFARRIVSDTSAYNAKWHRIVVTHEAIEPDEGDE